VRGSSFKRQGEKQLKQVLAEAKAVTAASRAQMDARVKAKREAELVRVRLTREDIVGARAVRSARGWQAVVRVNAKSVSVDTGYSWVDRIPFDDVLEVKS
jgi:hypothetical protein